MTATTFQGFPSDAFAFYAELEEPGNNTRAWFDANRGRYEEHVRQPMEDLLTDAADEFGADAKVFRPNRDVRFSKDKSPYKTNIAALVAVPGVAAGPGHYVQLDASGLLVGTGMYDFTRDQLERFRQAVDDEQHGEQLRRLVDEARGRDLEVGRRTLTRGPRGVDPDHPRIELLCHTAIVAMRALPRSAWLSSPAAADAVFDVWRDGRELGAWLARHVGG